MNADSRPIVKTFEEGKERKKKGFSLRSSKVTTSLRKNVCFKFRLSMPPSDLDEGFHGIGLR